MSIISKLFTLPRVRPINNPYAVLGTMPTYTGQLINKDSAMTLSAVYASIRILANYVSMIPLKLFEESQKGRQPATDHPLYRVLNAQPNNYMSSFVFRRCMMESLLVDGNAYASKQFDQRGNITALHPLQPELVTPFWDEETKTVKYEIDGEDYPTDIVLHIPGLGYDGIKGKSPLRVAAETISMGLTQQEYAARFYSQGITPGGILTTEQVLKKDQVDTIREELENNGGVTNAHRPLIMHSGMRYQTLAINPVDAQLIDSLKFTVEEISRIFGVPLRKLQTSSAPETERDNISFIQDSILPWLCLMEQEFDRQLLTSRDIKQGYTVGFVTQGLYRADIKSQAEALNLYRNNGVLTGNEARDMIGLQPHPDGDHLLANGNLRPVRELANEGRD